MRYSQLQCWVSLVNSIRRSVALGVVQRNSFEKVATRRLDGDIVVNQRACQTWQSPEVGSVRFVVICRNTSWPPVLSMNEYKRSPFADSWLQQGHAARSMLMWVVSPGDSAMWVQTGRLQWPGSLQCPCPAFHTSDAPLVQLHEIVQPLVR